MKINFKQLVTCILIPLAVGFLASILTQDGMELSQMTTKPPLSPPGWLFPIVWTILYTLMGVAAYLIQSANASQNKIDSAMRIYYLQLAVNFLWSLIFFHLQWYFVAFIVIIVLWFFIFLTIKSFFNISKYAAYLLLPYLLWVTFATYLTLGIWILN